MKNIDSPITTQRVFCIRFESSPRDPILNVKTIKDWLSNFRETNYALKKKPQQDRKMSPLWEHWSSNLHGVLCENTWLCYSFCFWLKYYWLHRNWVIEIVKSVRHCVGIFFRTFSIQMFRSLRMKYISIS